MILILTLLLVVPVTADIYVKVGDTLTLNADHLPANGTFFGAEPVHGIQTDEMRLQKQEIVP